MRAVAAPSLFALAALLAAGCAQEPTYHRDVRPIIEASCLGCHVAGGIAPFSLAEPATAVAFAGLIRSAVVARTMPPWSASRDCTDYDGDLSLTDEQIDTISRWADAGAPLGDPADAPDGRAVDEGLARVDLRLAMPEPYAPQEAPDDYRCFVLDWPETEDRFVTAFAAVPGNARLVHHVIAFIAAPEKAALVEELDAAEPGPGYTCFGGPRTGGLATGWLGVWVPGTDRTEYPDGTGIRVRPGSKIVLQVHYSTVNAGPGDTDLSQLELRLESAVARPAAIIPLVDVTWTGNFGPSTMQIAAGDPDARVSSTIDPAAFLDVLTQGQLTEPPILLHHVMLHLHKLGTDGAVRLLRAGGSEQCVLDIERWDFHWQRNYRLATPLRLESGDALQLDCGWDNSGRLHDRGVDPTDVAWGEGTAEEMCLGILYVSAP